MTEIDEGWWQRGRHFLRFNAVGAVGILVQLIVLAVLTRLIHLHYLAATVLAVEAAVLHNFCWHERWTWADRELEGSRLLNRLLRFNLANGALSLLGNVALMAALVGHAHMDPIVANILAIGACWIANFLVSDRLVFRAPS